MLSSKETRLINRIKLFENMIQIAVFASTLKDFNILVL